MFKILNRKHFFIFMFFFSANLYSQTEYNPFVSAPEITPIPLDNVENGGLGLFSFQVGNSGSQDMISFEIVIEITLSNGVPSGSDPVASLGGAATSLFSWDYNPFRRTYTGNQIDTVPAGYSDLILINYRVTENSPETNQLNGFSVTLRPGSYLGNPDDDQISLYTFTRCINPSAPLIESIRQPSCETATGSIIINGLPDQGTWTLHGTPGNISMNGNGLSATINDLNPGSYTFTVTNSSGCTSSQSESAVLQQPVLAEAPVIGTIINATCEIPTGSIQINNLPSGQWVITRYPGEAKTMGQGHSFTIELVPGTYSFTVTLNNCVSPSSAQAEIAPPPAAPPAPQPGSVTQPACTTPTGSVVLSGLPAGTWTIITYPGNRSYSGSGSSFVVTSLEPGTYNFTVTNSQRCTSAASANVLINEPIAISAPVIGTTTQPTCTVNTGSVILSGLPQSGTWTLIISPSDTRTGTGSAYTVTGLMPGITYRFAVRTADGCLSAQTREVTINQPPQIPAAPIIRNIVQPTCESATGSVELSGLPSQGTWTLTRSPGNITSTGTGIIITVNGLTAGTYSFYVTYPAGCTSEASSNIVINQPAHVPATPVLSNVIQPSCSISSGSILVENLPSTGSWVLTRTPGNVTVSGTGTSVQVTSIPAGTYSFRVTNSEGCTSPSSSQFSINQPPSVPEKPVERIDCFLGTSYAIVHVTRPRGSGLEYRLDAGDYTDNPVFAGVKNGNHTVTVRNSSGCQTTSDEFSVSCGCVNGPTINLTTRGGSVCGITPLTVNGNTFGGNATSVTITENGAGIIPNTSVTTSPFSFTYIPAQGDLGNTITITFTSNNPAGEPCVPAVTTYELKVDPVPGAPVVGLIVHPTCTSSTGNVTLSGLPAQVNWTLVRSPGHVSVTGAGAVTTVTGLESGTYTFSISIEGCTSPQSSQVVINEQPPVPSAPVIGSIVHPGCNTPVGSITLSGLPGTGIWTLVRYPGTVITTGNGVSTIVNGLNPGTYNFTVRSQSWCTSALSANAVVNQQPSTPSVPVTGTITAPTCPNPAGAVELLGLPSNGNWTINSIPSGTTYSGRGTSTTIQGLVPGTYAFNVTNQSGCISGNTGNIIIPQIPGLPVLVVNNPPPVCFPSTVDITASEITAGSTAMLTLTYWLNAGATRPYGNPKKAVTGTYYIKAVNSAQCSDIKPVNVLVLQRPMADAGPDQVLDFDFSTQTGANITGEGESGQWTVITGSGNISDPSSPNTEISNLGIGENVYIWTISNKVCPDSADTLKITVNDLEVPNLITPNGDGKNDYFLLQGIEELQGNELFIFDRRGVILYKTINYKNDWNGNDYNGKPLQDGTYFYVLKSGNGRQKSGFIVIRR